MPTYRPTNAGLQTKGTLWGGFDPTTSSIVAGVFMASVMLTFATISGIGFAWYVAVPLFFLLPNITLLFVVFFLIMGKPQRYFKDWMLSRIAGKTEVSVMKITEPRRVEID